MSRVFQDSLGRGVQIHSTARIVSLVPSITETLFDLSCGESVVGRTRYCVHPNAALQSVQEVGGTKKINFERLRRLEPDLIIAAKEENTPEMVRECEKLAPVFVTNVEKLSDVEELFLNLGTMLNREERGLQKVTTLRMAVESVQFKPKRPEKAFYFIWKNPELVVGSGTYIHSVLETLGVENLGIHYQGRYPVLERESEHFKAHQRDCERVFLSSEPFSFRSQHVAEFQALFPNAKIEFIDGELLSWFGARTIQMLQTFSAKGWEGLRFHP